MKATPNNESLRMPPAQKCDSLRGFSASSLIALCASVYWTEVSRHPTILSTRRATTLLHGRRHRSHTVPPFKMVTPESVTDAILLALTVQASQALPQQKPTTTLALQA